MSLKTLKLIRKIFRYRLTSVYFILSQVIVLIAVFGILQIYNNAFAKENDRLEAIAEFRVEMDVNTSGQKKVLQAIGNDITVGNVVASGSFTTNFLESGMVTKCEVILKSNEELPYKLLSGRLPGSSSADEGKNIVALGRQKYEMAEERNGKKYVTLDGAEYEVVGQIGSTNSDYWDYKIVFHIACIDTKTMKRLNGEKSFKVLISSNTTNIDDSYKKVFQNIMYEDSLCNIVSNRVHSTGDNTVQDTVNKANIQINEKVYIFCLLNCMVVSVFWIIQRSTEIKIKKIYGYSNIRIILDIMLNVSILIVVALLIFLALYAVYNTVVSTGFTLNGFSVALVAGEIFVTTMVTMIYPIYKVCQTGKKPTVGGTF